MAASRPLRATPTRPGQRVVSYLALVWGPAAFFCYAIGYQPLRAGYVHPAFFHGFRIAFFLQVALLVAAVVAFIAWRAERGHRALTVAALAVTFSTMAWGSLRAILLRVIGSDITLDYLWGMMTVPGAIPGAGLSAVAFWGVLGGCAAAIVALTVATFRVAVRSDSGLRLRVFRWTFASFVLIHVPVRGYVHHHVSRGAWSVLALDSFTPLSLRSELLLPWVADSEPSLPDLGSPERTGQYLAAVDGWSRAAIPRRYDILWIALESWRADALGPDEMPSLSNRRDRFSLRFDQHWAASNATQSSVFAMLTGLAPYHMGAFARSATHSPFLTLLERNRYRLRFGSWESLAVGMLRALPPPGTELFPTGTVVLDESDRIQIEAYLSDRASRDATRPSFDFLFLLTTHWPYAYPERCAVFPAGPLPDVRQLDLSPRGVAGLRGRYRNSCRHADELIERVLTDLDRRSAWDHTIVVITGDHGEEFLERGQLAHSSFLNAFQARVPLWLHVPAEVRSRPDLGAPSGHMDIVPTLLQALGLPADVLRSQGESLLGPRSRRPLLILAEQGLYHPRYHSFVTPSHISRWRHGRDFELVAVQRQDGRAMGESDAPWHAEVERLYPEAALRYNVLPDPSLPAPEFPPLAAEP